MVNRTSLCPGQGKVLSLSGGLMVFDAGDNMAFACALQVVADVRGTAQLITQIISQNENAGTGGGQNQQYGHVYNLFGIKVSASIVAIGAADKLLNS